MGKSQIVDLTMGVRTTFRLKYLKFSLRIFRLKRFVNRPGLALQFDAFTFSHDK